MNDGQAKTAWREVRLGEILRYLDERVELEDFTEYTTITVKRRHGGLGAREKLLGNQIKTKKQFRLVPGAFIISRVQCWHQAYALVESVEPNMIASTNYDQFEISPDMDRRFFWWLSHSREFTDTVRRSASGVVIEKMVFDRDEWLTKSVRIPPLAEQRRIVARIEKLAAKIAEARGLQTESRSLAATFLASECNRITTECGAYKNVLAKGIVSAKNGISRRPYGDEQGPIVLRLADLSDRRVNFSSPRRGALSDKEIEDYRLHAGDLLFIRVNGSREIVGRCIPFHGSEEPVCFNDHIIRVRLDSRTLDSQYVAKIANSPLGRQYMESVAITTAGQNTINHEMLRNLPVPIPTIGDQRRIVAYLDGLQAKVDALKRLQTETAAELDALLPAILDRAFKGEL